MGTFVTANPHVPLPADRTNNPKTPPTGLTYEVDASHINDTQNAVNDLLTHTSGWFNVRAYAAKSDGVSDDLPALNLATAACLAAGGGTIYVPAGSRAYRVTGQWLVGTKFVNEADITPAGSDYTMVGSYDAAKALLARAQPMVRIVFEPGATLWCDYAPSVDTAAIYIGVLRANQVTQAHCEVVGGNICSQDQMVAGSFTTVAGETPPSGHLVGLFACGLSLKTHMMTMWGCRRGIVQSGCFFSSTFNNVVFRTVDGITANSANASKLVNNQVSYSQGNALAMSGQGVWCKGLWTEECAVDVYVSTCDQLTIEDCYLETTDDTQTDYSIRFGQSGLGAAQCNNVVLKNIHGSRSQGKHLFLAGSGVTALNVRMYQNNVNSLSRLDDTASSLNLLFCDMPVDPSSPGLGNVSTLANSTYASGGGIRIAGPRDTTHKGLSGLQMGRVGLAGSADNFFGVYQDNDDTPHFKVETFSGRVINTGAYDYQVDALTADTTLNENHHFVLVNASGGAVAITLPQASTARGREYVIQKVDSSLNAVTITPHSGDSVDGTSGITMKVARQSVQLVSDGSVWAVTAKPVGMQNNGACDYRITEYVANHTLDDSDHFVVVDATSGNVTITIPASSSTVVGREYCIKRVDASGNTVTVARTGSDTLDGVTSFTLSANQSVRLVSWGNITQWLKF